MQKQKLYELLLEHSDVVATKESDLGRTTTRLTLLFTLMIKHPSDNIPGEFYTIRDMLTRDVIQPSKSPWALPVVIVRK